MDNHKMDRMIRRAQRMEQRVAEVKEQLAGRVFSGQAEGLVKVEVNGNQEVLSLTVAPELITSADATRLQTLVMTAVNDALATSKAFVDKEMHRATKGFSVPGI